MMTRAFVIGGGIAGPVSALALRRAGIDAVVFEARPAGSASGAWLTVAVNGLDALGALDDHAAEGPSVRERVVAAGFPSRVIELRSGTGKRLGTVPIGGELADGTTTVTLTRAALIAALHEAARLRGVRIEHGKRLVSVERAAGGGVTVRFDDGTTDTADLLIGADGVHSRVRALIDPGASAPRLRGLGNIAGYVEASAAMSALGEMPERSEDFAMLFGKRAFFGHVKAPDGAVWWFANPPAAREWTRDEIDAFGTTAGRERLARLFDDDRAPAAALIRATPRLVGASNTYDLPRVPCWSDGRMVLVGDAAHAVSPSSGQGASLAIEDAVELARCLRDLPSIERAFGVYEACRRPRVERVIRDAARTDSTKVPGTIGRAVRDLVLPLALRFMPDASARGWLFGHHIAWEQRALPDTPLTLVSP
ncbi:MAG: FAD-dependent monooxygenase [bacterium]